MAFFKWLTCTSTFYIYIIIIIIIIINIIIFSVLLASEVNILNFKDGSIAKDIVCKQLFNKI